MTSLIADLNLRYVPAMENTLQLQPVQQYQHPQQQLRQDDIQSSYKNQLQQYAHRAGLGSPEYHTVNTRSQHQPQYKCFVTVDELTYESPNTFAQKKAAEQDAAKHALKCIFEKGQEIGSSIINNYPVNTLCKSILNEFAARLQVRRPIYNTVQTQQVPLPVFVSTLEFRGVSYAGGSAKTKRDAEQSLAHDVILSILGNSEEDTTLLELLKSKAKLYSITQSTKDANCARGPEEGSNSADDGGASSSQFVAETVLISTSNETQPKDASKLSALHTEGIPSIPIQNPTIPSIPTSANEYSKVSSASAFLMPYSSQNPSTPQMQVFANEVCNITPPSQSHGYVSLLPPSQNPATHPMHSGETMSVPQVNHPVFSRLPQNPTPTALQQNFLHEGSKITPAPEPHCTMSLMSPYFQPHVTPSMHNFAYQSRQNPSLTRVNMSVYPGLPQNPASSLQNLAPQPNRPLPYMSQPPVAPSTAAPSFQDCSLSYDSQATKKRSRSSRQKANRRARIKAAKMAS